MKGKNVIITGASRGIGKAVLLKFAENGANVWACASRPNEDFERECQEISEKYGVWIKNVYFNLLDEESIKTAFKEIFKEKLPIDILVNNAGIPSGGLMNMTSLKTLREVMEANFIAQIGIIQMVSKKMMRNKSGVIVNMGSVGGIEAREGYLSYGSSKAAFMWATKLMAKELSPYNIRVNAVAPGLVHTAMGDYKPENEAEKIVSNICIKRMGKPEEIAEAVYFLASDKASFITGSVLNIDGGRLV